jgi:hypothetical protein
MDGRPPRVAEIPLSRHESYRVVVFFLLALWAIAPQKLVELHEKLPEPKALDEIVDASDKLTAGMSRLLRLVGVAMILWLGTSRRALDARVSVRLPEARNRFIGLRVVQDLRVTLDLPVVMDGSRRDQPWADLDLLFRKPSVALLIAGGKTTLACQIGRRASGEKATPPGGFPALPLLIDRDLETSETGDGLVPFLAGVSGCEDPQFSGAR